LPHISLQNEYGPTEATIAVTHLDHLNKESNGVIGKPIDNTEIFILGKYNELLPLGVIGELCVSGVGLSTGYINNDSLTADKFISHPLASDGKVYKTGDLAKWKEDGEIQLLGRVDNQIKIRGHRIELGEIEQILNDDNRIKEAFVLPYDKRGDLNLVAYFIEKESVEFDQLSESLNDRLP
jgi:non-ribosomal peptide synthetase component F